MSYRTDLMNDRPIVIQTLQANYVGKDTIGLMSELTNTLDGIKSPVFYILDLRLINLSFGDIMLSANLATRGEIAAFHHPNVIETLVVTKDSALRMAALGLRHPVFGSAKMQVFDTYDEAMIYANSNS